MAYKRRVGGGGVPCAAVVQYYCNSVGISDWRSNSMKMGSFTKALK